MESASAVAAATIQGAETARVYTLNGETNGLAPSTGGISEQEASRFLAQASLGATRAEMARVRALGYSAWIDAQFAAPRSGTRWEWLIAHGFAADNFRGSEQGFDAASWWKLFSSPDTLRQRVALALSEILVVGIDGLNGGWRAFAAAYYQDILENNAFGNFRQLLEEVSTSPAMGEWLTYRGNVKANPQTGALPDENYAREIMQLFSIGLVELNPDGTPQSIDGRAQYTYSQNDVMGLARVWTGWNWDLAGQAGAAGLATPDFQGRPMRQIAAKHESGEKQFLGTTIPAGVDGVTSMRIALDVLFQHPNVGPFIGKQLIQRLVTSNPSPAYVARVAAAFAGGAGGVRGDLRAVIRAILLDDEARNAATAGLPTFGKLREPMLRFVHWGRAFNASSATGGWTIGNTSDPATRLGQSPLRSPSVFNFFRPGYVPPNTKIGRSGLLAPEFQITNATSVVGYVNFMQQIVGKGIGDVSANYAPLIALADDPASLIAELNVVLAAGRIAPHHAEPMADAVNSMPRNTPAALNNRIHAAILLTMCSPEYIVQK